MTISTEPIGSIPRPLRLIEAVATRDGMDPALDPLYEEAIRDTIERFEATGSPVITDGEQRKYPEGSPRNIGAEHSRYDSRFGTLALRSGMLCQAMQNSVVVK